MTLSTGTTWRSAQRCSRSAARSGLLVWRRASAEVSDCAKEENLLWPWRDIPDGRWMSRLVSQDLEGLIRAVPDQPSPPSPRTARHRFAWGISSCPMALHAQCWGAEHA